MKKILLLIAISSLVLTACSKPDNAATSKDQAQTAPAETAAAHHDSNADHAAPAGDTAENALDWAGEYKGIFPCADCEGIEIELELKDNKTFELSEKYLGKGDGKKFESQGSFSFDAENPSIITLDKAGDNRKFFIGENFAEARDMQTGKAIDSKLNYKLVKEMH
ncbi:copper resistance protein NlpE [Acinetobacter sp.]|uniref:copper resistance protein NlpE n=1 Tax=Acinetobacter sp. TaxID=472 RepID=UPI0035B3285C